MTLKIFLISVFILIYPRVNAQNNNELGLYAGLADSEIYLNQDVEGIGSYEAENTFEYGIKYVRGINRQFSIETGINILSTEINISPAFTGIVASDYKEKIMIFSIPVYAKYDIGKYFYINGGPLVEFQDDNKHFDSQNGIGLGVGIGAQYDIQNFRVHLNPNFKAHAIIPFEKEKYHHKISQFGVQLGVGYLF
ncbi:MAG: outer membrane beta-barrel protein [Weeksellaceae bacterium]